MSRAGFRMRAPARPLRRESGRSANKVGPPGCAPSIDSTPKLGAHAAWRRKSASLAPAAMTRWRGTMIGRILPCLRDIAGQVAVTEALGDFPVGQRAARGNGARNIVDAAIEDPARRPSRGPLRSSPRHSPASSATMSSIVRRTASGDRLAGAREATQQTVGLLAASGNCTPTMPRALQTMPQRPIAVSNSA